MFKNTLENSASDEAIFILGFWRSGTTLLHELLSADPQFTFPTTYACANPHHFLITQKAVVAREQDQVRRGHDNVMVGWASPQEDEFALLNRGARSPYEGIVAPRSFGQALLLADPYDLSRPDAIRWEQTFMEFFRGVSYVGEGKKVLLKSPTHSYRVPTLRKLLPKSRFILIVRNPYDIPNSMMKTFRAFSYNFGIGPSISNRALREVILTERNRFEEKLSQGISGLRADQLITIKYEDLVLSPMEIIQDIYTQFQMQLSPDALSAFEKAIAKMKSYKKPENHPVQDSEIIAKAWADIFTRYNYAL